MIKIANHCHYHKKYARELIERIKDYHSDEEFLIQIEDESLALCCHIQKQKTCFTHSLTDPKLHKRASQKNQSLLKACNNKKRDIHSVVDLTAGWGRDSFILAMHGQHITMIEQNSLIFNSLNFLLNIVKHDRPDEKVYQQLNLIHENSVEFLSTRDTGFADCLYLDPMFPAHKSSARPGKELQILQLLTSNLNVDELFELALAKAKYRVVVKRPIHAKTLSDKKPDIVYKEKTIRFDVYLTNNH